MSLSRKMRREMVDHLMLCKRLAEGLAAARVSNALFDADARRTQRLHGDGPAENAPFNFPYFLYVCPEPVLANDRVAVEMMRQAVVFPHQRS
jgi:hypothetical protein